MGIHVETNRELHIELWQWLIDNPGKFKDVWPRWESNDGDVPDAYNDCFACEEARERQRKKPGAGRFCLSCPIKWGRENAYCYDEGAIYDEWEDLTDNDEIGEQMACLAGEIRDAWPEEKGEKENG